MAYWFLVVQRTIQAPFKISILHVAGSTTRPRKLGKLHIHHTHYFKILWERDSLKIYGGALQNATTPPILSLIPPWGNVGVIRTRPWFKGGFFPANNCFFLIHVCVDCPRTSVWLREFIRCSKLAFVMGVLPRWDCRWWVNYSACKLHRLRETARLKGVRRQSEALGQRSSESIRPDCWGADARRLHHCNLLWRDVPVPAYCKGLLKTLCMCLFVIVQTQIHFRRQRA